MSLHFQVSHMPQFNILSKTEVVMYFLICSGNLFQLLFQYWLGLSDLKFSFKCFSQTFKLKTDWIIKTTQNKRTDKQSQTFFID